MQRRHDIIDIDGLRDEPDPTATSLAARRKFLAVWFRCCHAYGRMYRNEDATAYTGRCPRCGATVRARIGPDGTSQRMFVAE